MNEQGIMTGLQETPLGGGHGQFAAAALQNALAGALDARPSALIIAERSEDREKLARMADAVGARLIGALDLEAGLERLDVIAAVRILVVQAESSGSTFSRLLVRLQQLADTDDCQVIIAVSPGLVDESFAMLSTPMAQLLCSPEDADLTAALALSVRPATAAAFHDVGRESEAVRLQRLSEEVSRIARTLASLSGRDLTPSPTHAEMLSEPDSGHYMGEASLDMPRRPSPPAVTARELREMLRLRRLRDQFFPGEMFADPAWDMLLDLMAARLSNQRVSVSSLCIAAAVPATTALRWIRALSDNGLFLRQADPADGRRVFIALSETAAEAMTSYFTAAKKGAEAIMV
ncbi:helix-turn-helix domain-containing protein [Rhizorhapis suberifaciens]|uniref:MarR family transcriptional regulator n=1 Tax=Rhizorhapis suberifaciens TaxID=13656 RepID=A0A840HTA9_9SPHN|nr:MarR family transcriptional regulator [Rhizorhapis suberifaciens]MBB4640849.1 hypothetical protein [Rhizorhapis suberifaciens]